MLLPKEETRVALQMLSLQDLSKQQVIGMTFGFLSIYSYGMVFMKSSALGCRDTPCILRQAEAQVIGMMFGFLPNDSGERYLTSG
jgi:hypothetical protein